MSKQQGSAMRAQCAEGTPALAPTHPPRAGRPLAKCVHALVEEQAARRPEAPALICGGRSWSYGQLNCEANQWAHLLAGLGVGPEELVGVWLGRSFDTVAVLLGIMKAGGAYVPLDPADPGPRVNAILENAAPGVLVTDELRGGRLTGQGLRVLRLEAERGLLRRQTTRNPNRGVQSQHPAYVVYTSGSTGQPKGVVVLHGSLANLVQWHLRAFSVGPQDRATQLANLAFDASAWETWPYLAAGARLYLAPDDWRPSPRDLRQWLCAEGITIGFAPTALATLLLEQDWPAETPLRFLLTGGDVLLRRPNGGLPFQLINNYGPTEGTVVATSGVVEAEELSRRLPHIGRPIDNTRAYVLDPHRQPVPVGEVGELYLGGAGLARGYWRAPELTAERFVVDPFASPPGARMYRTGDLARCRPDGNLEFVGRLDEQVKVRGYRIELGEIEAVLQSHRGVRQAVVTVREEAPGDRRLVACVVPRAGAEVPAQELRRFLEGQLPEYMIPAGFFLVQELPLTPNGKVDRRALAARNFAIASPAGRAAPRTEAEGALTRIWSEVLRLKEVGIDDNLFELGGDSILGLQIADRARQAGLPFGLGQLFRTPTIRALAQEIQVKPQPSVEDGGLAPGPVPLTPIQRFFFERQFPNPQHWNMGLLLEAAAPLDAARLREAVRCLLLHHEALRLRFVREAEGWRQFLAPPEASAPFETVELSSLPPAEQTAVVAAKAAEVHQTLNLSRGPLLRVVWFATGAGRPGRLLIVAHHLVMDGISWRIVLQDLATAYGQLGAGRPVRLPPSTTPFHDWATRLERSANAESIQNQAGYWLALNRRAPPPLPVDWGKGPNDEASARMIPTMLSADETQVLLREFPRRHGTQLQEVILAALLRAFSRWTRTPSLLLHLEGHGREDVVEGTDLARTVGWFTSMFPVLLTLDGLRDPGDPLAMLQTVKDQLQRIPQRGIGYGLLRYLSSNPQVRAGLTSQPQPELSLNYLGHFDQMLPESSPFGGRCGLFEAGRRDPGASRLHLLEITGWVSGGQLHFHWAYSGNFHAASTVQALAAGFLEELRRLIAHQEESPLDNRPAAAEESESLSPPEPSLPLADSSATLSAGCIPWPEVVPAPEARHEPFALTDIQHAYWIGRQEVLELGNVACHAYLELEGRDLDLERLNVAWSRLIERHEMLRAVVLPGGQQRILPRVPEYRITVTDLRDGSRAAVEQHLEAVREEMSHQVLPADRWPLFDVRASRLAAGRTRLHVSLDLLIFDGRSLFLLFDQWHRFYQNPDLVLPPLELSYRDYVLAEQKLEQTELYERSRAYWLDRLPSLPLAPELPLTVNPASLGKPRFQRRSAEWDADRTKTFKQTALRFGITPSAALLAAYAEVLRTWSRNSSFSINLTLFNRLPLHPQVNELIGDFTSSTLLEMSAPAGDTFAARARALQELLWRDLDHRFFSGTRVLRELARRHQAPRQALVPLVFTSGLPFCSADQDAAAFSRFGELVYFISQTPQTWLDHVAFERQGRLWFFWDAVETLFPSGMLDEMFAAYGGLLGRLATDEAAWTETHRALTPAVRPAQPPAASVAEASGPPALLHELFLERARERAHQPAVISGTRTGSFGELEEATRRLGWRLRALGAGPNQLVAVVQDKGWDQVVAVLGILRSGAAYLPVDPHLPAERRAELLEQAGRGLCVTTTNWARTLDWPKGVRLVCLDAPEGARMEAERLTSTQQPGDLAYVIFTSGSTGRPKGVMIDHQGVVNTILDINHRFRVGPADRVLALSSLNFDLSVYDIFGLLAGGGTVVLPRPEARKDPAHWVELMATHGVTVWNSVPALMQMLVAHLAEPPRQAPRGLRLVLLSGDWIPLDLPGKIKRLWPEAEVVSLGGATEASIWSIGFPVDSVEPGWKRIPYGRALTDQSVQVLNALLEECPVWVPGQIYIGGRGVAKGYWRDEQRTRESFLAHPRTGERLYRTGDLGRYLPDGNIELLGREDSQVKINGYRVELGEVEAALRAHPAVIEAVVLAAGEPELNKRLLAFVVAKPGVGGLDGAAPGAPGVFEACQPSGEPGILLDPAQRLAFRLSEPGLRTCLAGEPAVELPRPAVNQELQELYFRRQSFRAFCAKPIPLERLGAWLGCLWRVGFDGYPLAKARYPSAGGLYPVQVFLYVKATRVQGLGEGFYYYHPLEHRLMRSQEGATLALGAYEGINGAIFEDAAFAVFLVGKLEAIEPLYGAWSRDFCLLEAGGMVQLLMSEGAGQLIGLCPIGQVATAGLAEALGLGDKQVLLHSLLGGGIEPARQRVWLQAESPQAGAPLPAQLRRFLETKLPAYLVPARFQVVEHLPLSPNGKVDHGALIQMGLEPLPATRPFAPPATELEAELVRAFRAAVPVERVGLDDSFFELGADSLRLVQMRNRLQSTLGREVPIVELFNHPTIRSLAAFLAGTAVQEPAFAELRAQASRGRQALARLGAAKARPLASDHEPG